MSGHIETILEALEGGRGFALLRGLPVEQWSDAGNRIAIWGLGTHIGLPVGQDRAGNLLHDVRDTGRRFGADDTIRYYQTSHAIRLHTDGGDIFALGCVRPGARGGRSLVVSAVEVFNEIARRRPDLAVVLQEDFWMDARGQHPGGARCQVLPIYTRFADHLNILLKPEYILSAQRFDDVPRLTDPQHEALELFHAVTREPGMALEFDLRPGDVLLASNHTIMHGRTEFEDAAEPARRRHMLRLWLTIPNGRPLPPHYADTREFAETYRSECRLKRGTSPHFSPGHGCGRGSGCVERGQGAPVPLARKLAPYLRVRLRVTRARLGAISTPSLEMRARSL